MPPPPPPPPLSLSPPGVKQGPPAPSADRSALLSQIHQGAKLKKAATNDRSAPVVNGKAKNSASTNDQNRPTFVGKGSNSGLCGLFAQGMPKLRSTNSSFLQGGTYKSQLDPHLSLKSATKTSVSKSCNDLDQNETSETAEFPSLPNKSQLWSSSTASSRTKNVKNSGELYNVSRKFVASNDPSFRNVCAPPPPPPPASNKPNFNDSSSLKNFPLKSSLHNDNELGGSEPNLSTNTCMKPKIMGKPLLPPTAFRANSALALSKQNSAVNRRSYEDSDVPSSIQIKRDSEKSFEQSTPYSTLRNTTVRKNNNANGSSLLSPVAPARRYNKRERPVKPSVAPPPLPTRAMPLSNGTQSYNRTTGVVPDPPSRTVVPPAPVPPPPPPPVSVPPAPTPPPPPPPRIIQQNVSTMNRRHAKGSVAKPVQMANGNLQKSSEERFQFHSMYELPRPDIFMSKPKSYPSKYAHAQQQNTKRMCQPPPNAPPPPPPL